MLSYNLDRCINCLVPQLRCMCSVTLGRHCVHHVIQEIKFMGNREEDLKLCVLYSRSTPLLRRLHCELTSFIFPFDMAVFLCVQILSKNISVLLFHVHIVHTILKPLTMISTLQLEIQQQTVLLVWLYSERRSNRYFLLLSIHLSLCVSVSHSFSVSFYRALKHVCRVHRHTYIIQHYLSY